ncbi:MAG TPA: sigma 54-interacting transcriptional regulator [Candidatus Polarisedimenticolia bacterium]|nr:sigma 54-interacting transcriptional regulator [Candidatus Polarisedimenticolia bacterium]
MNSDLEVLAAPALAMRYETLVRMSRAIGVHRDLKALFGILMDELHGVVQFDFIGVSLRDQDSDTFQNYFIDMASRSEFVPEEQLAPEEMLTLWVYERQEPLLRSTDEMEPRYSRLQAILKRLNIRSTCALPLTTAHRKLGVITFCSKQVDTYSANDIRFVSQVADYIALAFDDALNFAALRRASEELQSKNDRLRLLLDVTNQVVSNLELRDLLRAISQGVRRAMQCDYAGLSLPDAENKQLRLYALDFPEGKGFFHEELVYSIEGSPSGTAFRTMKPLTLQSPFAGWLDSPIAQIAVREGLKSVCCLPLISRNRAIGVLVLGRLRDDAFSQADISFLSQVANQLALAVENAFAYREIRELKEQVSKEKLYLEDEIRTEMNFAQIIGNSASLRKVLKGVGTVAPTDSTVLIYGETGTGKELIARAIHDLSPRCSKPFVKLNCAAIPTGLLESELFGHEKGAFTGAIAQRIGRFEVADGGTIFLDEIGEIPLELQTKLLRVLQEREFERLGSSRTLRTNARLIAATNRDLEAMVAEQKFRSDLFFRLNVFPVHVPPLRERQEDIPLLVRHFTQQFSRRMKKVMETIPSAAMDALSRYHWPGNIRELQNVIERAVIISAGPDLSVDVADLKFPKVSHPEERAAAPNSTTSGGLHNLLEETERQQILQTLKQCNWVVAGPNGAAARLGMNRSTLQVRIRRLGISRGTA